MNRLVFSPVSQGKPEGLSMGESYGGQSFGCNERYLERNGKPWLPVMAEFHPVRYDCEEWETELLKIKAAGIDIVSTYLFWIFHEENQGEFRFDGKRDIARFLRLCKKVGLYAFVRIGPWCHGECRNGGFPDWLVLSGIPLRCNDERYLKHVRRLFCAYSRQISPCLFGNGGAVIGIQLENELSDNGEHLAELKRIALSSGLHAPYYTVTGWGPRVTDFPYGEVLPVFGCYPAAPWEGHTKPLGINKNYFFSSVRNDSSIGSDRIAGKASDDESILQRLPFLTCELGPGNQLTYHRRPTISAADVLALAVVSLGSGSCMPGYYMFHGGFNPSEGLYQESKASGYSNDLPVSSYDFQAPLDEYGQHRESYLYLKRLHQFVRLFGETLAPMTCTAPDRMPESLYDTEAPRMYYRGNTESGFIFFNTHQRRYPLPPVREAELRISFGSGEERSYGPVNIASGTCGVFPVRHSFFGITAEFMTLLPLWTGEYNNKNTLVAAVQKGVSPYIELKGCVNTQSSAELDASCDGSYTRIRLLQPDKTSAVDISDGGAQLRIIVLSERDSLRFYPVETKTCTRLVLSDGIAFSREERIFTFTENEVQPDSIPIRIEKAAENRIGGDNIYSPYLFCDAADCPEYILDIPISLADKCCDAIFSFGVRADVIQLYADDILIADDFLKDKHWRVSLKRILPYIKAGRELRIKCSPVRADRKIYLNYPVADGLCAPVSEAVRLINTVEIKNEYGDLL